MRVFLDANILFSAARAAGAMRELLRLLQGQGHVLLADSYVLEETRRNLGAKEPASALVDLERLTLAVQIHPTQAISEATVIDWLPAKDRPVLANAIALQCDALVTGDKTHFGAGYGRSFSGVTLYSPAQLAEKLLGTNE